MTSTREQGIQLRAYAKWNPENDPEKIAKLEKIQEGINEGTLVQLGRAVVRKNHPNETRAVTQDRFKGVKLGRALIYETTYDPIKQGAEIGDGCLIVSSDIDGDSIVANSTIIESRISGSLVYDSELHTIQAKDSIIIDSGLSSNARDNLTIKVDKSHIISCELTNTPVTDAELTNVFGSSGGKTIEGGPLNGVVLTSIGDSLFVAHLE